MELQVREFYGYYIYSNGEIYNKKGKRMAVSHKTEEDIKQYKRAEVGLTINGKRRSYSVARLVYCVFNDIDYFRLGNEFCVTYKDGDKLNLCLENLKLVKRKDLIQGEKNKNTKLTDEEVYEIKRLYNSTKNITINNQFCEGFQEKYTLGKLAKQFNVTKGNIKFIISNESRNKDNYVLR